MAASEDSWEHCGNLWDLSSLTPPRGARQQEAETSSLKTMYGKHYGHMYMYIISTYKCFILGPERGLLLHDFGVCMYAGSDLETELSEASRDDGKKSTVSKLSSVTGHRPNSSSKVTPFQRPCRYSVA